MLPFQTFAPTPDGTNVTRGPEAESKLLNVIGLEVGVMLHEVLPE